jgi:hypothetical protein
MTFENLQNNFANTTALIFDRTLSPPRVLAQAFIVSKSRAVTCASAIFNYAEAPWALAISFLHPGLTYGVKSISIHPEFDKNAARTKYIAQTGWLGEFLAPQLNDLATIVLDLDITNLEVEKVGQLHKALTLPFSTAGVQASGLLRADELLSLINKVVESKQSVLLTVFDSLNMPIAHIQFDGGEILKVHYGELVNELAFSELLFRRPVHAFALQVQTLGKWGELPDMNVPAQALIAESLRRADELPSILANLGGKEARYQRAAAELDFNRINPQTRVLAEALWHVLDGYTTVDKLAQLIGVDTYLAAQGLKELINFGFVALLNRESPFALGGQLGLPLTAHMDFDINQGDMLLAFYLNPYTGAPTWRQGHFAGVASVLQPKNLLHTIALPNYLQGALILKDYKLVGVHSGPISAKSEQERNLVQYQMMWIGALLDMTSKKLRTSESAAEEIGETAVSGLRGRTAENEVLVSTKKPEKYICPSCFATNASIGACFNCGKVIEAPEPVPEPTDLMSKLSAKLNLLDEKYGISRIHLVVVLVLVIFVPSIFMILFHKHPLPAKSPVASVSPPKQENPSSPEATKIASTDAGLSEKVPPTFWYEDTQTLTKPTKSFALMSKTNNQKVQFLIFDDLSPLQNLSSFAVLPPYCGFKPGVTVEKVDSGTEKLDRGDFNWMVGRYKGESSGLSQTNTNAVSSDANNPSAPSPDATHSETPQSPDATSGQNGQPAPVVSPSASSGQTILVGAFPGTTSNSAILLIAQALSPSSPYDYKSTLWLIDQLTKADGGQANKKDAGDTNEIGKDKSTTAVVYANDEELDEFCKSIQEKLQNKYSLPSDVKEEIEKKKLKRPKVSLSIQIDNQGQLKKIEITQPGETEKVTNILVKDVNACIPFENVPKTKDGTVSVMVTLKKDEITVERP